MRILLSNDDGIEADGLKCLERVARSFSNDVWVVAPERDQSGASHSLSLMNPVRYRGLEQRKFAVEGTPTDCILLGVRHLIPPPKPDLVLTGINCGGNLGDDVTYSGTVAGAVEGTLHGIPSIALSQYHTRRDDTKWATAEHHAPNLIRRLVKEGWAPDVLININFPNVSEEDVKGVSVTFQGKGGPGSVLDYGVDPRGKPYVWINSQRATKRNIGGSDVSAMADGRISLTPLNINLTHLSAHKKLGDLFNDDV